MNILKNLGKLILVFLIGFVVLILSGSIQLTIMEVIFNTNYWFPPLGIVILSVISGAYGSAWGIKLLFKKNNVSEDIDLIQFFGKILLVLIVTFIGGTMVGFGMKLLDEVIDIQSLRIFLHSYGEKLFFLGIGISFIFAIWLVFFKKNKNKNQA